MEILPNKINENNVINIQDLIDKIKELPNGIYNKDNIKIIKKEIIEYNNSRTEVNVITDKYGIQITFYPLKEKKFDIKINNKVSPNKFSFKKSYNESGDPYSSELYLNNNIDYYLTDEKIVNLDSSEAYFKNGHLLLKNYNKNNNTIGYDFENSSSYIFLKKQNTKYCNIDDDYIKIKFDENTLGSISNYNDYITKVKDKIKQEVIIKELKDYFTTMPFDKISYNVNHDIIKKLEEAAYIYNEYEKYLDIKSFNNYFNDIFNVVNYLLNNKIEAKINNLENTFPTLDLNNLNHLECLKKEIKDLIKAKRDNVYLKLRRKDK